MVAQGPPPASEGPQWRCPGCGVNVTEVTRACKHCGLLLVGTNAQLLWHIDQELAALNERHSALHRQRAELVQQLRTESATAQAPPRQPPAHPAPAPHTARPVHTGPAGPPPHQADPTQAAVADTGGREITRRSAQNIILGLGALLVGIAALVFVIWAWSDMGTGARATVLALVTLIVAGLTLPLHRRGLHSTAETFGALAALLLCIDALALWLVTDRFTDELGFIAAALAVISVLLLLFPFAVPLRGPRFIALMTAQPVPFFAVASLDPAGSLIWLIAVISATALADVLLLQALGGTRAAFPALRIVSLVLWLLGLFLVIVLLLTGPHISTPDWWVVATCLLLSGVTALLLARGSGPPHAPPGSGPAAPSYTVAALLILGALPLAAGPEEQPLLSGTAQPLWADEAALALAPAFEVLSIGDTEGALPFDPGYLWTILVSGCLAVGAVALLRRSALPAALALTAPATLLPLPLLLGAPLVIAVGWAVLVSAALLLGAAWAREPDLSWVPTTTGLLTLALGLSWALSEQYTGMGALLLIAVVCAVAGSLSRTTVSAAGAAAAASFATGGFALALPLVLGAPVEYSVLGPVAVVAGVAVAAPRLRSPLLESAEVPAALWALAALVLSAGAGTRLEVIALAQAVLGVIALASAVRPHRRWLAVVGALLMFAALWTILAAWDVTTAEVYTVPPAIAALIVGWEWNRKSVWPPPSWLAYGGGLVLLLLPTVGLVLAEDGMVWRVPAVIAAGLAIAVWGLRKQLQAALVLGGLALVLASLRAFGPPLWDLTQLLPNWVPFAVAGTVLLVVGARYESTLPRLRRIGRRVSDMH